MFACSHGTQSRRACLSSSVTVNIYLVYIYMLLYIYIYIIPFFCVSCLTPPRLDDMLRAKKWYEDVGEDDLIKEPNAKNDASFDI